MSWAWVLPTAVGLTGLAVLCWWAFFADVTSPGMREEVVQAEADVVRQQQVVEELEKRLRVLHMQQAHYLYGNRQRLIERHLAKLPEPPYDPEVTDVTRASHLAPCPDCGIAYWLHPHAKEPTTTCGYDEPTPFLCLACDGRRLKL